MTEHKRRGQAAPTLQAHLLENVPGAICALDPSYRVIYWNRAAEELFGWASQEALGRSSEELLRASITGSARDDPLERLQREDPFRGEVLLPRREHFSWADVRSRLIRSR